MSTKLNLTSSAIRTANFPTANTEVPVILPPPSFSAQVVINAKYGQLGGAAGFLGHVVSGLGTIASSPNDLGYFVHYQGGSIYLSPQTDAHEAHGDIRDKWASIGWEQSFLGYPVTDETGTPDGIGRYNHFQGGSIYWTPSTGAHEVHGAIRDKWASMGWEQSFLGYPVTDETGTPDGIGRYNHFQGGSIYWTPSTGAYEIHGAIRDKWASMGWEQGFLGYPISDEHESGSWRLSNFQNGTIFWTAASGAQVQPQAFVVDAPSITFGSGIAVGGHGRLTIFSDGTTHFQGHLHDSGFPSYDCLAVFAVKDTDGRAYAATHGGRTHGTDEQGSRDLDWDDWGRTLS